MAPNNNVILTLDVSVLASEIRRSLSDFSHHYPGTLPSDINALTYRLLDIIFYYRLSTVLEWADPISSTIPDEELRKIIPWYTGSRAFLKSIVDKLIYQLPEEIMHLNLTDLEDTISRQIVDITLASELCDHYQSSGKSYFIDNECYITFDPQAILEAHIEIVNKDKLSDNFHYDIVDYAVLEIDSILDQAIGKTWSIIDISRAGSNYIVRDMGDYRSSVNNLTIPLDFYK